MAEKRQTELQNKRETVKDRQVYKITYGLFASKREAVTEVITAKKKGYEAKLIVDKGKYKLLFAEENNKEVAQALAENIKRVGINVDIE